MPLFANGAARFFAQNDADWLRAAGKGRELVPTTGFAPDKTAPKVADRSLLPIFVWEAKKAGTTVLSFKGLLHAIATFQPRPSSGTEKSGYIRPTELEKVRTSVQGNKRFRRPRQSELEKVAGFGL
jgi:hypothetical protein